MQFPPLEQARLLRRYKRFLADIELASGEQITIHCPNTGSMLNCMREGGQVWFSRSNDPKRKLPGTWEISETPQGRLACVNTGRANAVVEEALRAGVVGELAGFTTLKREVAYGEERSRIDFYLEYADGAKAYVEVKSVTLEGDHVRVAFTASNVRFGVLSRVNIKLATILGSHYLEVIPAGTHPQPPGEEIPTSRTAPRCPIHPRSIPADAPRPFSAAEVPAGRRALRCGVKDGSGPGSRPSSLRGERSGNRLSHPPKPVG